MIPVVEQLQDHKNVCSWTPEGKRYRKKKKNPQRYNGQKSLQT